ncbi:MAG: hypothetical protein H5U02_14065 [Clostridia bacterium]|nr:hypothetical protein [Clostridia bacterium]
MPRSSNEPPGGAAVEVMRVVEVQTANKANPLFKSQPQDYCHLVLGLALSHQAS